LEENTAEEYNSFRPLSLILFQVAADRKRILEKYDCYVSEYGQDSKLRRMASSPASYFSMPIFENNSFYDTRVLLDNLIFRELGSKALNQKTKNYFIQENKFMFLKIDLTYDKEGIKDAVDDIIDKGQKLTGNTRGAKRKERQKLFDQIFTKLIVSLSRDKALSETSKKLEKFYKIKIKQESLLKRYYNDWRKKNGITNLREWKKQQRGTND